MKNNDEILDSLEAHTRRKNVPMTHYYLNLKKEIIFCFIQTETEDKYLVTNENDCDVWLNKDKLKLK